MARQWLIPGGGFIDEHGNDEYLIPEVGFIAEDTNRLLLINPPGLDGGFGAGLSL